MRVILPALFILTGCIADASAQSATIVAVPAALSEALAEYRCMPVADDAQELRHGRPWWISLKSVTGGDTDFAFYCQISADKPPLSKLVVVVRGENNPWRGCGAVVDSFRERFTGWFPYDLAVASAESRHSSHTDLRHWWLVSSASNSKVTYGPAGVKVPNPIIDTIGQMGAGSLYACYSRQWYVIGLD